MLLPDTAVFHAALCAAFRTGRVAVGIGSRSGIREISHLIARSEASVLVTTRTLRGVDTAELVASLRAEHPGLDVVFADERADVSFERVSANGELTSLPVELKQFPATSPCFVTSAVSMLNSTSGTTGLPKLVTQTEDRWVGFSEIAAEAAAIGSDEVFLGAVPAPFGFGLWTSHFLPALLGARNVVMERFDVSVMIELIERERVTALNCVSTQFKMLLRSEAAESADLSSLRFMFTGGEAVPYSEALAFEQRTGAAVLQFYGSNETGAVSVTTVSDGSDTRLKTCGHVIDRMQVRVFDDAAKEMTGSVRRGQPGVNGPLMCQGYWGTPMRTTSCTPTTVGCFSATSSRSTRQDGCVWSGAKPTSSFVAARTSPRSKSRSTCARTLRWSWSPWSGSTIRCSVRRSVRSSCPPMTI
ncbi:class I adenylate-forming enzyme family protein [Rhodococcus sp. 3Y1]